jgi:hypothetical protein
MVSDYSGHLVACRSLLDAAEQASALHNFGMALAYLTQAQVELASMNLSLTELDAARASKQ